MLDYPKVWQLLLLPFTALFYGLVFIRKKAYQFNFKKIITFEIPVIIVGNISMGGSGKTPLTIALVQYFQQQGYCVGVVSRGYGGQHKSNNLVITDTISSQLSGDEANLIYQQTKAVVVVNKNRVFAVKKAIDLGVNLVISDDGLQHYRMGRQVEIAVIDNIQGFGNGYLLPSGILREPISRLDEVNIVVYHQRAGGQKSFKKQHYPSYEMQLKPVCFTQIKTNKSINIDDFLAQYPRVYAVAAIAQPDSFFAQLKDLGFKVISKAYSDHYLFNADDFKDKSNYPILMTQKDCVKCVSFANEKMWFLSVEVDLPPPFFQQLDSLL